MLSPDVKQLVAALKEALQSPAVDPGAPTNYGTVAPFPTLPVAGGVIVTNNVQLLSARVKHPMQWVVTLSPITRTAAKGTIPWSTPWDGKTVADPYAAAGNQMPSNAGIGYKVLVTWGAGGVRSSAVFDYPAAGGCFGITADTLDLNVFAQPSTEIVQPADVPVFGAFMVPGTSAGAGTVRLTDVPQDAPAVAGETKSWSVKQFARYVWVSQGRDVSAAVGYEVRFGSFNGIGGTLLWSSATRVDAGSTNSGPVPIPVPAQATFMTITQLAGGDLTSLWSVMWEISLA